ncbi:MAG: amino acid racemase [Desulfurococcales archaeon]|nr:amino acid racemase [Desulfurococcales archaeon]
MLGIIGGLSPYSTILYYKEIVERYYKARGEHPELVIHSVPIQRVQALVRSGDLEGLGALLSRAARALENHGATHILIAANTPHIVASRVEESLGSARFISILDAVWRKLEPLSPGTVGLLATGATVRYRLYHDYLEPRGVRVVTPPSHMQKALDEMISNVARGMIDTRSRLRLGPVVMSLISQGAEALILGCTELPLLMSGVRISVPVIDSLDAHVSMALGAVLEREK